MIFYSTSISCFNIICFGIILQAFNKCRYDAHAVHVNTLPFSTAARASSCFDKKVGSNVIVSELLELGLT